eukprot:4261675-Prymnesium_polylepis.1
MPRVLHNTLGLGCHPLRHTEAHDQSHTSRPLRLNTPLTLGGDTGSAVPVKFSRPPHTQSEQRREQREANT